MSQDEPEPPDPVWSIHTICGRKFNVRNGVYILPSDNDEFDRQDMQHVMLKMAIESLYAPRDLVRARLGPRDGPAPGVLDLGCGTGLWAIQMAEEFEHAEVLGIDSAFPPNRERPVNCKFETDDINLSLEHYANCFDVIHLRMVDQGIENYAKFLYGIARLLRPDGVLLLVKPEMRLYSETKEPMEDLEEGSEGFSYVQKILMTAYAAIKKRGGSEDAQFTYKEMLTENPNYEKDSVVVRTLHIPISPWRRQMTDHDTRICELSRRTTGRLCIAYKALLLSEGLSEEVVNNWILKAEEELNTLSVRAYTRWTYAWALRTRKPWQGPLTP